MWEIDWTGDRFTGESADAVLAAIAAVQWDPPRNIRRTISDRLWNTGHLLVDDALPADQFLRRLAELGVIRIITEG